MITFKAIDPRFRQEHAGHLPDFFTPFTEYSAAEQINLNYAHGGGWSPIPGFRLESDTSKALVYPGDPPYEPIAWARLQGKNKWEDLYLYRYAVFAIFQEDGTFEVGRLD